MKVIRMSPEEHDQRVALISHLPHVLAAALVAMQAPQSLEIAGKGFLDSTRIAAGDPVMWRDILINNADQVRQAIRLLGGHMKILDDMLASGRSEELWVWLSYPAEIRQKLNRPADSEPTKEPN
jgi:prephenate dehydrogenase